MFGTILKNSGTVNIYVGTVLDSTRIFMEMPCVSGGTINMYGGTIKGGVVNPTSKTSAIRGANVKFIGGTIESFNYGVYTGNYGGSLIIGGNAKFNNNKNDIVLDGQGKFTIQEDFNGIASVSVYVFGSGERRIISENTSQDETAGAGMDGALLGAASIFGNNSAQGYILMGIICFFLGVCVTVLLYRLRRRTEEKLPDEF